MNGVSTTGDSKEDRAAYRRAHDVAAAVRTLRLLCDSLDAGYRFDDAAAPRKREVLRRAVDVLERESGEWIELIRRAP